MEEPLHNAAGTDDDDEDDIKFSMQGSRLKHRAIIDDDSEEEKENLKAVNNTAAAVVSVDSDEDSYKTHQMNSVAACSLKDANNSMDHENKVTDAIAGLSGGVGDTDDENVIPDDDDNTEVNEKLSIASDIDPGVRLHLKSDIFDTEISDEDTAPYPHTVRSSDNIVSDERFDENEVNPELLAKLKKLKGASKSGQERRKYQRKAKPKAEEMLEIYSESQRLLRDSRVNLPYHEPEPKLLEDFLARANKKRQEYAGLKHAKDIQKAEIICKKLSVSPHILSTTSRKHMSKSGACLNTAESEKSHQSSGCHLDNADDKHVDSQLSAVQFSLEEVVSPHQTSVVATALNVEDSELPDLLPPLPDTGKHTVSMSKVMCGYRPQEIQAVKLFKESSQEKDTDVFVPSLKKDPSRDLFMSQSSIADVSPLTIHQCHQDRCRHIQTVEEITCTTPKTPAGPSHSRTYINEESHSKTDINEEIDSRPDINGDNATEDISVSCPLSLVTSVCSAATNSEVPKTISVLTPASRLSKSNLLDRFEGLNLPALPSLSGTPDGIICLDDADPSPVVTKPGLIKLLSRLVQHTKKNEAVPMHHVTPSIHDGEEPKMTSDCVIEGGETDKCSGCKLDRLKEQLGVSMKKKRAEARQRRLQYYALENEEGFEQEDEEEDAELEISDCDDEEDTQEEEGSDSIDDNEEDDYKLKMDGNDSDDDKDYNPFMNMEARDDDDESDDEDSSSGVHLHFDVSEDEEDKVQDLDRKVGEKEVQICNRKYQKTEVHHLEEDSEESRDIAVTGPRRKKGKSNLLVSDDDDDDETTVQEKAKSGDTDKKEENDLARSPRKWSSKMTPLSRLLLETQKQSEFRRENSCSPDLYSAGVQEDSVHPRSQRSDPQGLKLPGLDDDGFIKITQTQPLPGMFLLHQSQDSSDINGSSLKMSAGQIFHGLASPTARSGSSQLGTEEGSQLQRLSSEYFVPGQENLQRPELSQTCQDGQDDDVYDPFHVLSDVEDDVELSNDNEEEKQERTIFSDSDSDHDSDTDQEKDEGSSHFTELKMKKRKQTGRDFLEDEAELSGSEYDSDENFDLAEEDDILEEEDGDHDLLGVSEEKLRDEVGRLHMKQLQDDDERDVMRFKEMYLQDGDLYSEGGGRMRNFHWKDKDFNSEKGRHDHNSDDEQADDDIEDAHWRKDRFEREKFLEETDCIAQAEDSQVLKMGQFFLKKQESIPHTRDHVTATSIVKSSTSDKLLLQKKGSFLSRGQDTLVKIAQMVKSTRGGNSGKNSRNFVFQTRDGPDSEGEKAEMPPPVLPGKRKAHSSSCMSQTSKKPKLALTTSSIPSGDDKPGPQNSSIFKLFQEM